MRLLFWLKIKKMHLQNQDANFDAAEAACWSSYTSLAKFETEAEFNAIVDLVSKLIYEVLTVPYLVLQVPYRQTLFLLFENGYFTT